MGVLGWDPVYPLAPRHSRELLLDFLCLHIPKYSFTPPLTQAGDTPNQSQINPPPIGVERDHGQDEAMEQGSEPLLFDGDTHPSVLPARPCCPEATRQTLPALLEPGAPQPLHKVLLLGNIHRYPGAPTPHPGSSPGRNAAWGGGRNT